LKVLTRKVWREIWRSKIRSSLIILSVSLSIALYGSLDLLEDNVQSSRTKTYTKCSYEDAAFRTIGFASRKSFSDITNLFNNIKVTDTRLSVYNTIYSNGKDFNGIVHGINSSRFPEVNNFSIISGHFFSLNASEEVLVESHFAESQNVEIGDKFSITHTGETAEFTVVGIVFSPEYMFVINPQTSLPEPGSYSPIWIDLNRLQDILHQGDVVNEFFILVHERLELDSTIDQVNSYLLEEKGLVTRVKRGDEEDDFSMLDEDIDVLVSFSIAFSLIVLIVTVVIIYDSLTKIITAQRTIIGVLRSLGAKKQTILFHYLQYVFILTLVGVILSLPLGYALSLVLRDVYVNLIGLRFLSLTFKIQAFTGVSAISILVALFSGFFIALKSASVMPSEAMSGTSFKGKYQRAPIIERISDHFLKNHRYTRKIPIRNIFSRKKRSLLTALTIGISTLIILSSFGAIDSANHQIDLYFEKRISYDLELYFSSPVDPVTISEQIRNINGVNSVAGIVRQPVVMNTSSIVNTVFMAAYPEKSSIRTYSFQEGNLEAEEVILGSSIAKDLNVTVGDIITLTTQGYDQNAIVQQNFNVSGILTELFDKEVFMTLKTCQKFTGLGNNVTALAAQVEGDKNIVKNEVKKLNLPISMIQDIQQTKISFVKLIKGMVVIAGAVSAVGLFILVIFSLNIIILDVMERNREFVNLRVSGANWQTITKVIALQIFLIALIVLVLFIPLTQLSTMWLNKEVASDFMTITTYIAPLTYLIGLIVLIIGLSLGVTISIRHILRVCLADATRISFQN
jgi:putative ABC transport system permease protein